ncbi:MAG: coproporphyrinogen III oxidase family protein [Planctomycetes bacterium]|nr:coproporphyrinogen III oxidase family protein [Planctomycetota bacterium]
MDLDVLTDSAPTEVGSYFVANYPPFSAWSSEYVPAALKMLESPAENRWLGQVEHGPSQCESGPPSLGLYIHIPFCRKRCKFCYFRVYTDKNSRDVEEYVDALAREIALYADRVRFRDRQFEFVYFGGGTPSFLSNDQLKRLVERINKTWRWDAAREVTFECEPGTLKKSKIETIKSIGVTRISLGLEHFDDEVLELNGRAHKTAEIRRAFQWIREVGFAQVNVDLIAGMVGDTDDKWEKAVEKTLALEPDSLTVYQMELPHNTVFSQETRDAGGQSPVADWATKRRWANHAFEQFEAAGYVLSSGYTLVKPSPHAGFAYRDSLWHGADMIGTGVASFSHVGGVHYQNFDQWGDYVAAVGRGELPLARALPMTDRQRLIRELILQLKLGKIDAGYFRDKFAVEIRDEFADAWRSLDREACVEFAGDEIRLTRPALLRVDGLLPRFFEPQFRGVRYT